MLRTGLLALQQSRMHGTEEAACGEGPTVLTPSGSSGAIWKTCPRASSAAPAALPRPGWAACRRAPMLGVAIHSADRTAPRHSVRTCMIVILYTGEYISYQWKPAQSARPYPFSSGRGRDPPAEQLSDLQEEQRQMQ